MPRSRSTLRVVARLPAVLVALVLLVEGAAAEQAEPAGDAAAGWEVLLGGRPRPQLGQRQIVVLRAASLADRVRAAGGLATEADMRAWTATASRAQASALAEFAQRGVGVAPEHSYVRVLNGFAASLDASAVALLERDELVEGVYPVRATYPAASSRGAQAAALGEGGALTHVDLPGFDGRGVTVALLDTGVDYTHPYLRGTLLPGIDILDPGNGAVAQPNPAVPGRPERHGTELAGLVAGHDGPAGLRGVAPAADILPIRVAGWQLDAVGGLGVYGRTDQMLAGLEAAVDPDANGDTHDAARIALVGVSEPFASFPDGPLARAAAGARDLGTLVVAPAGNDGPAGPGYGSVGAPAGTPAALAVAAADARRRSPTVHVLLSAGLRVLLSGVQPLGGAIAPTEALDLDVTALPATRARGVVGRSGLSALFDARGYSRVAGRAALLPPGSSSPEAIREAALAGARAVLVDGVLPAGALGVDEPTEIPVLGLAARSAREVRTHLALGAPVTLAIGAPAYDVAGAPGEVAPFSSRGLAFDATPKPEVAAPGVGLATSVPGRSDDGAARYGTVSGSSAAAAVAAGAAALLAQARPDLDAAGLRGALVASAAPLVGERDAAAAGAVDVDAAAAAELVVEPPTVSLGVGVVPGVELTRIVTVRNVSRRTLTVRMRAPDSSAAGLVTDARPARLRLRPGGAREVTLSVSVGVAPRAPGARRGVWQLSVAGGRAVRLPWAVGLPATGRPLVSGVRLTRRSFPASDAEPAVLSFVAGRVDGAGGRPQVLPLSLLDVELSRGERRLGRLVRLRDLLPGRYALGLTGRGPGGRRLPAGGYSLHLVATPAGGGEPQDVEVPFRIE